MNYLLRFLVAGQVKTGIIYATVNPQGRFEYCSKVSLSSDTGYHEFAEAHWADAYITYYWEGKDFFQCERYQKYRAAYRNQQEIEHGKRAIAASNLIKEINSQFP